MGVYISHFTGEIVYPLLHLHTTQTMSGEQQNCSNHPWKHSGRWPFRCESGKDEVAARTYPVCSGVHIAEELHSLGRGPSDLHGQTGIKWGPCDPRSDQAPVLERLPPLQSPPHNRPLELPIANSPCMQATLGSSHTGCLPCEGLRHLHPISACEHRLNVLCSPYACRIHSPRSAAWSSWCLICTTSRPNMRRISSSPFSALCFTESRGGSRSGADTCFWLGARCSCEHCTSLAAQHLCKQLNIG